MFVDIVYKVHTPMAHLHFILPSAQGESSQAQGGCGEPCLFKQTEITGPPTPNLALIVKSTVLLHTKSCRPNFDVTSKGQLLGAY
jgi:hypothetical protein